MALKMGHAAYLGLAQRPVIEALLVQLCRKQTSHVKVKRSDQALVNSRNNYDSLIKAQYGYEESVESVVDAARLVKHIDLVVSNEVVC